ncbi:gp088 [Rhodococcus phage ReqiPoco6]|uniref:Gp088 n=1 Tax=Rhodococcus phage ReqiPoco6 TaxID=691964 RepID=D4P7V6_9CAUD|nr:gp088 [Rhodococcus phage ReqiPoco6]ADD81086.1 gp088 [Rhodococcus phage ReqiPoco6]
MILIDILLLTLWLYGLYLASQKLKFGYVLTVLVPIAWSVYEISEDRYELVGIVVAFGSAYFTGLAIWVCRKRKKEPKLPNELYFIGTTKTPVYWELRSPEGKQLTSSKEFYQPKIAVLDANLMIMEGYIVGEDSLLIKGDPDLLQMFYEQRMRLQGY